MNKEQVKEAVKDSYAKDYFVELFESEGVDITQSFTINANHLAKLTIKHLNSGDDSYSHQENYNAYLGMFKDAFPLLKLTTENDKRAVLYDVSELDFVSSIKYL
tara:strand:- start:280 stop:591 length:312 start_codon:yes stop_codon:yes gene_type:complete